MSRRLAAHARPLLWVLASALAGALAGAAPILAPPSRPEAASAPTARARTPDAEPGARFWAPPGSSARPPAARLRARTWRPDAPGLILAARER